MSDPSTLRAVGYVRVSTEDQARGGISLDVQRERIRLFAESRGLTLGPAIHADEGLSGRRSDNRPALAAAVAEAVEQRAPLIVYSLSRFARSTRDCLELAARLDKGGAGLISLSESIDTTSPHGRFFFVLVAALAQLESDQTSERMRAVAAYKKARNEPCGERPFGRIPDPADPTKLIDGGPELATLRQLVEGRLAGKTWQAIADEFAAVGKRSRRGKPYVVSQLHRLFYLHAHRLYDKVPDALAVMLYAAAGVARQRRREGADRGRETAVANAAARRAARPAKAAKPLALRRIVFGGLWTLVDAGQSKTTRRRGFADIKPGQRLLAIDAAVNGSRACEIEVTAVRREALSAVTRAAVKAEGFGTWTPTEYVAHFTARHGGRPEQAVTVITFRRVSAV